MNRIRSARHLVRTGPFMLFVLPALLVGCASPVPVYSVSSANVSAIRAAGKAVELGEFSGTPSGVTCRAFGFSVEGGKTFAQFIRSAFNDEIVIAGVTAPARSKLSLALREVSLDCAMGTGSWTFDATVAIENQAPFSLRTVREFEGAFAGDRAFQRAQQAFNPAVAKLIADIMAHPAFKAEFGNR